MAKKATLKERTAPKPAIAEPKVSARLVMDATEALVRLKHDVENGRVSLTQPLIFGIADDKTFHSDSESSKKANVASLGSISGDLIRHVIIYETVHFHDVSFGIFDHVRGACLTVNTEQALMWMMPTGGHDIVERDLIEGLIRNVEHLYK